jgi:glycosidase
MYLKELNMSDWAHNAVFYHIYPLGLCGAPTRNDFTSPPEPRLAQINDWIEHLRDMGINAMYLGPLFESSSHGYDTADYYQVDRRLGSNADLAALVTNLHASGIRVILDSVFHHVGRDFWAFRDLQANGERSPYRDWFMGVDFGRRNERGDAFVYEGWRGHDNLVKLNLHNPDVRAHIFGAVQQWVAQFGIDGLRLDVAEDIDLDFLRALSAFCRQLRPDFWLLGETIHGDYRTWANAETLDATTNYELYKGLFSSHNDRNYFEIAYSLNRQFGENGMYNGLSLYNFADNHDVNRIASTLVNSAHLYPLHALLFTMPGVPSIYYGSEWGIGGVKQGGDDAPLRPRMTLDASQHSPHADLAQVIARLARIRHESRALRRGTYQQLFVAHKQFAFARRCDDEQVIVAVNAASEPARLRLPVAAPDVQQFTDMLNGAQQFCAHNGHVEIDVPPCWARILR